MGLKKLLLTLSIAATLAVSTGFINTSVASAQYRRTWEGRSWYDRHRERDELNRIRRYDYQRQLRYRMSGPIRMVGYYDRFGRFHAYGFYDRFGRFHRY